MNLSVTPLSALTLLSSSCHERGLVHAYWAANFWALYLFADRVLVKAAPFLPSLLVPGPLVDLPSPTKGLVRQVRTGVLPGVTPTAAALFTFAAIIPALVAVAKSAASAQKGQRADWAVFVRALGHAALSAFVFGWHVHEKAILVALVPLGLISTERPSDGKIYLRLSAAGLYALFPLFTHPRELVTKALLYVAFMRLVWCLLETHFNSSSASSVSPPFVMCGWDRLYAGVIFGVFAFCELVHPLCMAGQMEFLPLMVTSVSCAIGVVSCWVASAASLSSTLHHSAKM